MFNREQLVHFTWLIFFLSLPFSKWLSTVCELSLLALTIYKFDHKIFRENVIRYKHVAFLALLLLCLLIGLLYTENISNGFRVIRHQHRFLVIPLLFLAHAALIRKKTNVYLTAFVAAAAASGLVVAILYWLPEPITESMANNLGIMRDYPDHVKRTLFGLYSPFIERIQLSSLIAIAIISSIYLISIHYKKLIFLMLLVPLFYVMLILGGRGGQVSLMGALLLYGIFISVRYFYPVFKKKTGKTVSVLLLAGIFVLAFAVLPWVAFQLSPSFQDRFYQTRWELQLIQSGEFINYSYQHFTTLNRIASLENMWELVKQNPILGTGTGDYHQELEKVYQNYPIELIPFSHNQYLMLWAMTGVFTLLAFLAILFYWMVALSRAHRTLFYYAASFMLFYLLNMTFDTVLFTQVDSMAFCAFFSMIGLQVKNQTRIEHA